MDRITVYWEGEQVAGWPVSTPPAQLHIPRTRAAALDRMAAGRGITPVELLIELVERAVAVDPVDAVPDTALLAGRRASRRRVP